MAEINFDSKLSSSSSPMHVLGDLFYCLSEVKEQFWLMFYMGYFNRRSTTSPIERINLQVLST